MRKTRKTSLKHRRRTLKRKRSTKKGGAEVVKTNPDSQTLIPPKMDNAPEPSNKIV